MNNKVLIWFLIALLSVLAGDNAVYYFRVIPIAVIFYVLFLIGMVKIFYEGRKQIRHDRAREKNVNKVLDRLSNDVETLQTNLELKADKPAKSNIRHGSKPSGEYFKMLSEKEVFNADNRTENSTAKERQGAHAGTPC